MVNATACTDTYQHDFTASGRNTELTMLCLPRYVRRGAAVVHITISAAEPNMDGNRESLWQQNVLTSSGCEQIVPVSSSQSLKCLTLFSDNATPLGMGRT